MFFDLTNSPATFQVLMNTIFVNLIAAGKRGVYLDNISIWSSDLKKHHKVVHEVLHRLEEHNLYLQLEKCKFKKSEIEYLDLVVRKGKVAMDPVKVEAITSWPTPKISKMFEDLLASPTFIDSL